MHRILVQKQSDFREHCLQADLILNLQAARSMGSQLKE